MPLNVVDLELWPGGLTLKFEDGSEAVGTFKVVDGILTMEGLDALQQIALAEFNDRIDQSAIYDPRLASLRCLEELPVVEPTGS
jgi:hypothetical protein